MYRLTTGAEFIVTFFLYRRLRVKVFGDPFQKFLNSDNFKIKLEGTMLENLWDITREESNKGMNRYRFCALSIGST